MKELNGMSASRGTAMGALCHFENDTRVAQRFTTEDAAEEFRRFDEARCCAIEMLGELHCKVRSEIGVSESMIFEIHQLLLADQDYLEAVKSLILDKHYCADYAVQQAGIQLAHVFSVMDNAYMNARGADMLDISNRIVRLLRGECAAELSASGYVVLAANELLPSEMIALDRGKVRAVVTSGGSAVSHSAMLARAMEIPAVIGIGAPLGALKDGETVLVDGTLGAVFASPDEATLWRYGMSVYASE